MPDAAASDRTSTGVAGLDQLLNGGLPAEACISSKVRRLLDALTRAREDAETANRLKDEFLATLSHELRTPLNAILGWTAMLRDTEADMSRLKRGLEIIDRNAQAQAQLVEDVLDMARVITGKLRVELQPVPGRPWRRRAPDGSR